MSKIIVDETLSLDNNLKLEFGCILVYRTLKWP